MGIPLYKMIKNQYHLHPLTESKALKFFHLLNSGQMFKSILEPPIK